MLFCVHAVKKTKIEKSDFVSNLMPEKFITELQGKRTRLYKLWNENGMEVCITNYGGRIVSITVPDKNRKIQDVVLGFDSIQDYIKYPTDFGATIGRYANRIKEGNLNIDGKHYKLPQNNYGHCLLVDSMDFKIEFLMS